MTAVTLKCERGNAQIAMIGSHVRLLTGQRRKWDVLYFSWFRDGLLQLQGLYRGRYADAVVTPQSLIAGLEALGASELAADVRDRLAAAEGGAQ